MLAVFCSGAAVVGHGTRRFALALFSMLCTESEFQELCDRKFAGTPSSPHLPTPCLVAAGAPVTRIDGPAHSRASPLGERAWPSRQADLRAFSVSSSPVGLDISSAGPASLIFTPEPPISAFSRAEPPETCLREFFRPSTHMVIVCK